MVTAPEPTPTGPADALPVLPAGPFRLRAFEPRDVAMVVEASVDPVIPLISSVPPEASATDAAAFVARQRHRLRDGYGYSFVIAEITGPPTAAGPPGPPGHPDAPDHPDADADRGVGSIGLWLRDIDLGRASVGYWVVPSARGRRAAGFAVASLAAWVFDQLAIPRLELHVEPWNVASIRTAERAGFVREGLLRSWQGVGDERRDVYVYSLLPTDSR